jgi:hypothetical protein
MDGKLHFIPTSFTICNIMFIVAYMTIIPKAQLLLLIRPIMNLMKLLFFEYTRTIMEVNLFGIVF